MSDCRQMAYLMHGIFSELVLQAEAFMILQE